MMARMSNLPLAINLSADMGVNYYHDGLILFEIVVMTTASLEIVITKTASAGGGIRSPQPEADFSTGTRSRRPGPPAVAF